MPATDDSVPVRAPSSPAVPRAVVVVLLGFGTLFCWGTLGHLHGTTSDVPKLLLLLLAPVALAVVAGRLARDHGLRGRLGALLARHDEVIDAIPDARLPLMIALAAGAGLFVELAMIRLHASQFQLFSYFKNVSLFSCFLGLGIGYARGGRSLLGTPLVLPMLTLQLLFTHLLRGAPFLQDPIPEQTSLGMTGAGSLTSYAAVYGFLGLIFTWNALCFVPLGQVTARLMMRRPKLQAYGYNLLGSVLGILLFNAVSFIWAPPVVWMFLAVTMVSVLVAGHRTPLLWATISAAVMLTLLGWRTGVDTFDIYSPYQKITVKMLNDAPPEVRVSNVYFQRMLDLSPDAIAGDRQLQSAADYYSLPFVFAPDAERALVVGSGTGNDVAAALRAGVAEVDAVEIDPAILRLGRKFHPELPYASRRVRAINDDARAYLRSTDRTYDVIVYGLLDSHTLLSGVSSVRLDSFIYTVEGFRDARARLRPGGTIAMTFSTLDPQLAKKILLMLREAFDGRTPKVFRSDYDGGVSFVIGDELDADSAVGHEIPFREITDELQDPRVQADVSTDDWPFLYMPVRRYPSSYLSLVSMLVLISMVLIRRLAPAGKSGFSPTCFFLGAGFMLVEAKAITELALVFGSTWIVIGAVITAILIMAYLANLVILRWPAFPKHLIYPLLVASVVVGLVAVSLDTSVLGPQVERIVLTLTLTLPLFFSGLAFSSELAHETNVAAGLSANMLGAMLGGFLEYNAMYFGYRALYLLAIGMYLAAFWGTVRKSP